jgi:hypothetical protein
MNTCWQSPGSAAISDLPATRIVSWNLGSVYRLFPFVIIDSNVNLPLQIGSQLFCHILVFMKKVSLIAKKKMETLTAYSLFR